MGYSKTAFDKCTENLHPGAFVEKLIGLLQDGKQIESIQETNHADQYLVAGYIYFTGGVKWAIMGGSANAEYFHCLVRRAIHDFTKDYDAAELVYRAINLSHYRCAKISDIKHHFGNCCCEASEVINLY